MELANPGNIAFTFEKEAFYNSVMSQYIFIEWLERQFFLIFFIRINSSPFSCKLNFIFHPGQVIQLIEASFHTPKGFNIDPWSGHILRFAGLMSG